MEGERAFRGLDDAVPFFFDDEDWTAFDRTGFLELGPMASAEESALILACLPPLAGGDPGDQFREPAAHPLFELMHHPLTHEICDRIYGPTAPVGILVAGILESDQSAGWRQSVDRAVSLDRDEVVTALIALGGAPDPLTIDVLPGSHRLGAIDASRGRPLGGRLRNGVEAARRTLVLEPGHALLLHKWVVHRPASDVTAPMVTFCFVDGRARNVHTGYPELPLLRGSSDSSPYPCVELLTRACAAEHEQFERAQAYARSLERRGDEMAAELERLGAGR